ncbi:MAG: alpha-D-ribose 1-methylphosphonate 5-triphosphate diphosphatase [Paracoccaceae bacterium]
MKPIACDLIGADVLLPDGVAADARLSIASGQIQSDPVGRNVDLRGYLVLPGIVDPHGDGFERHMAPRRGAMKQMNEGIVAAEAELAANGISTAVLAQFWSWEGGLRSPEFAAQVFDAIAQTGPKVCTDLRAQLRFETALLDDYEQLPKRIADWGLSYLVFNDHLPHDRLAEGRKPARLTGQALKAGRNPDDHFAYLLRLHAAVEAAPAALDALCARLCDMGVYLGSHDDRTEAGRARWRRRGARIAEFPETTEAAEAAKSAGDFVVLGAPNVVRGGSHKGNASALDLIAMGLCDGLASDYHYPSLRRAALMLARTGVCDFAEAWALVSDGPARMLGLTDRGRLAAGKRADLVVLEKATDRVAATFSGGQVSYMSGEIATRFIT